ncbi:pectate lyase [Uliginosibacterium sp. H3]|uniref:Pectate lyase n=1 Tax=Uliginosibacterium silvisoli TaxID=3114758 RepID=A0ABU6K8T8_9RHOO|nr:pectate lyase [Uliginosibacterium sp. H3]
MKLTHLLGALALVGLSTTSFAASDAPSGYTKCVQTGATCTFSGTRQVAMGKAGVFGYGTFTSSVACTLSNFPSAPSNSTWCSYAGTTSTSSSSSTATSSSSSSKSSSSSSVASSSSSSKSSSSSSSATTAACKPGTITGTVDCGGITVGTACDGQSESQQPVFTLAEGAVLKNVHIKAGGGADGIHCAGNCTMENVVWDGICEDAATMTGGTGKVMKIVGGSATKADDKVFQHNGKGGTINISNFQTFDRIQRLWASCGNCESNTGPRYLIANNVTINGPVVKSDGTTAGYVLRLNSNYGDKATVRSMRIKGYSLGNPKVCVQATGITKAEENAGAKQVNQGEFWNTAYCDISKTDVTSF